MEDDDVVWAIAFIVIFTMVLALALGGCDTTTVKSPAEITAMKKEATEIAERLSGLQAKIEASTLAVEANGTAAAMRALANKDVVIKRLYDSMEWLRVLNIIKEVAKKGGLRLENGKHQQEQQEAYRLLGSWDKKVLEYAFEQAGFEIKIYDRNRELNIYWED